VDDDDRAADNMTDQSCRRDWDPQIGANMGQRIIAIEEHYSDPELASTFDKRDASKAPHVRSRLDDIGALRIREMDEAGITMQVISHASPSTQALPAGHCVEISRGVNDRLAERIRAYPDRFSAFAALPTSEPEKAADELSRTVEVLGFCGAMLHGRAAGTWLDDHRFWPIFKRAQDLDVPIYLHPSFPDQRVFESSYQDYAKTDPMLARAALGYTVETATQAIRMVLSGLFDACPGIKIIIGHLGEALPFLMGRIDESLSRNRGPDWSFRQIFRRHFHVTTSGHFSTPALTCTIAELGIDRILFAVDWPYVANRPGVDWMKGSSLSATDKTRIFSGNAERLLKIRGHRHART
jgi:2,3-dihydroxybenzoate decarboxylase